MSDKQELPPPSLGRTILNLLPLMILTLYLCQNRPEKNPKYQLDLCAKNLHQIGVKLEEDRISSDDQLHYKQKLEEVMGKEIPACPIGGKGTYEEGYQPSADLQSYVLSCKGEHHVDASVPSDYPRIAFSVEEGYKDGSTSSEQDQSKEENKNDQADEPEKQEEAKSEQLEEKEQPEESGQVVEEPKEESAQEEVEPQATPKPE